jgi:hypothetical protein
VYGFLANHEAYYTNTVSAATVALLQSDDTLSTYLGVDIPWADLAYQQAQQAQAVGNFTRAFYGYHEMLLRNRIPFDVVDQHSLTDGSLRRYDWLILPNAACLSDAHCAAVADYVAQGGRVIADFETSHYDENGRRRQQPGLAEVFGVTSRNRVSDQRRWDYVFVDQAGDPLYRGLQTGAIPAPYHNLEVQPLPAAQVHGVFSQPIISNIAATAAKSEAPFLVVNAHGLGTSYYFPAMFGQFYEEAHPAMYPRILQNIITTAAPPPLRLHGPPHTLDVHLRAQPHANRLLVHLANFEIPTADQVIPARDLTIELRVTQPVRRVRALKAGLDLPFTATPTGITFTLPVLEEFEVVAVDWPGDERQEKIPC